MPRDDWVDLDGLRLHYRDWGGSGQTLVLIHGLASTCHIWDMVAPILSESFAVVALDQRGHGESDKPDCGYDFATVAADLHGFIGALGVVSPVLVGHSWGGNVALECAFTHPSLHRGLCLIDGGTIEVSAAPGMTLERAREEMAPPDLSGLTLEQLRGMAGSRDFGFELTPRIEQIMFASFDVLGDNTIRPRFNRENHMQVIDAFWEHKPLSLYPQIRCPVLLMPARRRGKEEGEALDRKEEAIALARRLLPVSKTVWLEDSVHDVPLQRPELVAEVIAEHIRDGFFGQGQV